MSGNVYIRDHYVISGALGDAANEELFLRISSFFDNHPGYQRIASSGSVGLNQSYRVWTAMSATNKFDVVLKWSYGESWNFWLTSNMYGVGLLVGAHPSGQAWNGTTTNTNDVPPFAPFKSGSTVMSRQSSAGGDHQNTKYYFHQIKLQVTPPTSIVCSGDNDSFCFALNEGNNTSSDSFMYFGKYNSVNPDYNFPYIFINSTTDNWFDKTVTYGILTTTADDDACVACITSSTSVTRSLPIPEKVSFDYLTQYTTPMPRSSSFLPFILEYPIAVIGKETGGEYLGYLEDIRMTHNTIGNLSRLYGGNRLVISQSSATGRPTLTIPWLSSSSMTSGSFFSSSQCMFLTGSSAFGYYGSMGISVDRLGTTDPVITVVSQTLITENVTYRGWLGGQYVYSDGVPPGGASDVVIVKKV